MRGPKPKKIVLAAEQITHLQQCLRTGKTELRVARRARILLLSNEGLHPSEIGERAGCDRTTVWRVCRRFEDKGTEAIHDAPRPGAPPKIFPPGKSPNTGTGMHSSRR